MGLNIVVLLGKVRSDTRFASELERHAEGCRDRRAKGVPY